MIVIPALLEKDIAQSVIQIDRLRLIESMVPWIQIDFMDGTMTEDETCSIEQYAGLLEGFIPEVHLMTTDPESHFEACESVGAQRVYVHAGACANLAGVLRSMDKYSFAKGIALSPSDDVSDVLTYCDEIDAVQVMTVEPGRQGGTFLPAMLDKVPFIRERRTELWISVDGGVNRKTIDEIATRGVDAVGVGSAISESENPGDSIMELMERIVAVQEV